MQARQHKAGSELQEILAASEGLTLSFEADPLR